MLRPTLVCCALLASCTGEIVLPVGPISGDPRVGDPAQPGTPFDATFACDGAAVRLEPTSIKRLSKTQWLMAAREVFSRLSESERSAAFAAAQSQIDQLPDDSSAFGARGDGVVSPAHADAVFEVALALATHVAASTSAVNALVSVCGAGSTRASLANATCLGTFVDYYGAKALRRPLTSAEKADLVEFYGSLGADGVAGLLGRLLAHPRLYYQLENDGEQLAGTDGVDATYRLTRDELTAKLTFLFWEAPPDDALRAEAGSLSFEQLLERVMNDPRARKGVASFYRWWLDLDHVPQIPGVNSTAFQAFAAGENIGVEGHHHRDDMIREVLDLSLHYTLDTQGRYEELFTSPYSFAVTDDLAKIYGVPKWNGDKGQLVPLTPGRSGVLTRAALVVSGSEVTRPVAKGHFVRERVLCDEVSAPPSTLKIEPLRPDAQKSQREIVEQATADATCQACHARMNPLGFTSEGFDALGRVRSAERKLDSDGSTLGTVPLRTDAPARLFSTDTAVVADASELGAHIAASGKGQQCMVKQYFRFTFSRHEAPADGCDLEAARGRLVESGGNLRAMFAALTRSDAFQQRRVK